MTIEEENKNLRMVIEKLKGIIYEEQTFNEVNKKENERLRKENEEIRETLTRARFRLEEENQTLRQQIENQNKENTKLKMEKLLLKTVMKKMKLCGICKSYEQEDCECSLCGETVNIWETCEKWEFLGIEEDEK